MLGKKYLLQEETNEREAVRIVTTWRGGVHVELKGFRSNGAWRRVNLEELTPFKRYFFDVIIAAFEAGKRAAK